MYFDSNEFGPQYLAPNATEVDVITLFLADELVPLCSVERQTDMQNSMYNDIFFWTSPHARATINRYLPHAAETKAFLGKVILMGLTKRSCYELILLNGGW